MSVAALRRGISLSSSLLTGTGLGVGVGLGSRRQVGAQLLHHKVVRWSSSGLGAKPEQVWPPLRYDPDSLGKSVRARPVQLALRGTRVMSELLYLRVLNGLLNWGGMQGRAERLRGSIIRLGPAFTKVGQALATRRDILPKEYCDELSKLQDNVPPFPQHVARELLTAELGRPIVDVFEELTSEPIAAASLAQVYRGRLRESGDVVAVKIQRPNLREVVALDTVLLRSVAGTMGRLLGLRSDLAGVMDELVGRIFEEMDFKREAAAIDRFHAMYDTRKREAEGGLAGNSGDCIVVPKVHHEWCTSDVLVMEWVSGVKLTDLEALRVLNADTESLLDAGVRCSLRQLLREGNFHADPHPGNLLVTPDGGLAYLDFGMMCSISKEDRYGLLRLLVSFVNRDAGVMSVEMRQLGFLPHDASLAKVEAALSKALEKGGGGANTLERKDFQGVIEQVSDVLQAFEFRVPPRYALIIRALVALEGTATHLRPEFKVVAAAYPIVLGFLLEDRTVEMRRILRSMILTNQGRVRWSRVDRLVKAALDREEPQGPRPSGWMAMGTMGRGAAASEIDQQLAAAMSDALEFLEQPGAENVRREFVKDILGRIDTLCASLEEKRKDPFDASTMGPGGLSFDRLKGVNESARWLLGRVHSSPGLWLPLAHRAIASPATQEVVRSIVKGGLRRLGRNFIEVVLLQISRWMHTSKNNIMY